MHMLNSNVGRDVFEAWESAGTLATDAFTRMCLASSRRIAAMLPQVHSCVGMYFAVIGDKTTDSVSVVSLVARCAVYGLSACVVHLPVEQS